MSLNHRCFYESYLFFFYLAILIHNHDLCITFSSGGLLSFPGIDLLKGC